MKKLIRASFSFILTLQPLRLRQRPDRQKHLFLTLTSAIMIFVRDGRRHYHITQVHKKEIGDKNKKIIRYWILASFSFGFVFWFCWMAKFGCQPLLTHSGRLVPHFHSREFFKKRLQSQSDVFDYCLYHRKCNFGPFTNFKWPGNWSGRTSLHWYWIPLS